MSEMPNKPTIPMDSCRIKSAGMPLRRTIVERNRVKNVKLDTKPVITPSGRALLLPEPATLEVRMMGSSGNIHGERMVKIPARKEKRIRMSIDCTSPMLSVPLQDVKST
jgi:hypothetical protein